MTQSTIDRRHFFGAGALAVGAAAAVAARPAQAAESDSDWDPAMEASDAWMDKPGTRHRIAFDCTEPGSASAGLGFANNYIHTSISGYRLTAEQLGVIVILRHGATPFAYNDSMWVKYGKKFIDVLALKGDQAKAAPTRNPLFAVPSPAPGAPKGFEWFNDMYISRIVEQGVMFAVCGLATQFFAAKLAGDTGDAAAINAELAANLVPNAHMMPSGIVAVGHVQEHGYAFAYVGAE